MKVYNFNKKGNKNMKNIWNQIKNKKILNCNLELNNEFITYFDKKINGELKNKLINFVTWIEKVYGLQCPVYIDFEYKNYLYTKERKRVGYLFYWDDFKDYPNITGNDEIPIIVLPVKEDYWTFEEIIGSFVEALTDYYKWCLNIEMSSKYDEEVDIVIDEYFKTIE